MSSMYRMSIHKMLAHQSLRESSNFIRFKAFPQPVFEYELKLKIIDVNER